MDSTIPSNDAVCTTLEHNKKCYTTSLFRWPTRTRLIPLRRRRVLPTVRLGGKKNTRRKFFIIRILRRIKLRWIKMKLKKLREYYHALIKDVIDGNASVEAFQQRLLMEASFAIPVMGLSINTFPSRS
ncbi:Receptor-type tyrosine-protein like [Heracleum sosnowskyi]|uniref:Receptor-type tyrosine-protein like n=1 Tax=Heracleum sosnowskyi TaxID=360622 RepID=A0AAD8M376_9APIA|nr:Receptor-type tyrosine-protein like [Heracleum sosnowskyi]